MELKTAQAVIETVVAGHADRDIFLKITLWVTAVLVAAVILHLLGAFVAKLRGKRFPERPSWRWWEKIVYALAVLAVSDLAFTSIHSIILHGQMSSGWLLAHMAGAGMLLAALPLLALLWGWECLFHPRSRATASKFSPLTKCIYWLFLAGGVTTAASILASMFPLLDTHSMEIALQVHRLAGLATTAALLLHLYLVLASKLRLN